MAIRNIRVKGDPILKLKSRKIERLDARLFALLDDMRDTMYKADGCGLAAVQVGVLKRAVVIDVGDGLIELINPEIVETKGEQCETEGCGRCGCACRRSTAKATCANTRARDFWRALFVMRSTIWTGICTPST